MDDFQLNLVQLNIVMIMLYTNKQVPTIIYYKAYKSPSCCIYIKQHHDVNVKEVDIEHRSCLPSPMQNIVILGVYRPPSSKNAET